jgi:RHS repeat-associated protein
VIEQFGYDKWGRTIAKSIQVLDYNDLPKVTRYQYDDVGNITRVDYPTRSAQMGNATTRTISDFTFTGAATVEAIGEVNTAGTVTVEPSARVSFRSGNRVVLKSGFRAKEGSRFVAEFGGLNLNDNFFGLDYSYNNLGQVQTISGASNIYASYTYNVDGSVASETTPITTRTFAYDRRGRLLSYNDGFLNQTISYAGYLNGNISATNFTYKRQASSLSNNYTTILYDRLGRLTSAASNVASHWIGYNQVGVPRPLTYDKNGNILSLARRSDTVNYRYALGTNKVMGLSSGKSYSYDLNGNITSSDKASNGIGYDAYTQMTTAIRPSATEEVRFSYDASNERVLKVARTPTTTEATLYLHGLSEYPLVDKIDNGDREYERHYIYGATGLLAIRENNSETYIIRDHLGSTRLVVSQDGSAGIAYSYDALGKTIADGRWGASEQLSWARYFYTGQELDTETGLQNFRARFYDDDLFRFYAMDPAGQQTSPYAFNGNSPLVFVDRNGKEFFTFSLIVSAVISGAIKGAVTSAIMYSAQAMANDNWNLSDFGKAVGMGALRGGVTGGVGNALGQVGTSLLGGMDGIGRGLSSLGLQAINSTLTSAAGNLVTGQKAFSSLDIGVGPLTVPLRDGKVSGSILDHFGNIYNAYYHIGAITDAIAGNSDLSFDWSNMAVVAQAKEGHKGFISDQLGKSSGLQDGGLIMLDNNTGLSKEENFAKQKLESYEILNNLPDAGESDKMQYQDYFAMSKGAKRATLFHEGVHVTQERLSGGSLGHNLSLRTHSWLFPQVWHLRPWEKSAISNTYKRFKP